MKLKIIIFFLAIGFAASVDAQNSALSMYQTPNDNAQGDIIIKTARASITTACTYFCVNRFGFTNNENGGYSGFQDSPDKGHCYIYSIWDASNNQTITAAYVGSGTVVENFGGEGTGLKSMNSTLGWTLGQWYSFATRRWDVGNHTYFGYWVRDISGDKWTHLVTMDYPVGGIYFNGTTYSFLEDWSSTGQNVRKMEIKDGFKRKTDGTWLPMTTYTYSINSGDAASGGRSYNYRTAYDAGLTGGGVYMQAGGSTAKTFTGLPPVSFNVNPGTSPANLAIAFTITSATTSSVSWNVPASSTPQFKYTIKVNGTQVASAIASEARSKSISASSGVTVEVILEDILGRTSSKTATVGGGSTVTTVKAFDSEETVGENGAAVNAIDNNNSTIWHTKWYNGIANLPHYITLDLGASYSITGLNYLPRQVGTNGMIKNYEIYVSTDNATWGSYVKTGTWVKSTGEKKVTFTAKTGRYVKLVAKSEVNGNQYTSAAEIKIVTTSGLKSSGLVTKEITPVNVMTSEPEIRGFQGNIYINAGEAINVKVYNLTGGLVLQKELSGGQQTIAIPNKGIYIVKAQNINKQVFTKKVYLE
ncbi:MAG: DUF3472 domain-containing protein [Bacteroidales bacterium]|nr:MAG: DUF3472 domain-containing protein [Bacteroidales bacterium]